MTKERLLITWVSSSEEGPDLLVRLVSDFTGVPSEKIRVVNACRSCGSDQHGQPHVVMTGEHPPAYVSLSRSGGLTVVAVTDAGRVGVDVEAWDRSSPELVTWVRKESVLKSTGHGLTVDHALVRVSCPSDPPELIAWPEPEPIAGPAWMFDLRSPDGYVAAATVLAQARPRVVQPPGAQGA